MLISSLGFSQEVLEELPFRHTTEQKSIFQSSGSRAGENEIIYLYDTLQLPIIDEFTRYRLKIFPVSIEDPAVFDSASYRYTINGEAPDSVSFRKKPAYNIVVNPFNGDLDSTVADSLLIHYYDTANVFKIASSQYVHRTYNLFTQNGITRRIDLPRDSIIYNQKIPHYFARDDGYSYWISRGGFWNRTMSIDPPTLGVITFDGLDSNGNPYDNSSKLSYGLADHFESKPINLFGKNVGGQTIRYGSSDSIYLSFFYQNQGYGDRPEEEDSLVLEFYSPLDGGKWNHIWAASEDTVGPFQEVFFHINDTNYLQKGFRFRFKNYSTLSGNFDHWHIDYIRLDEKRGLNDEIEDFAVSRPIRSTVRNYTSMPWEHYKLNPWENTGDTVMLYMRNLSSKPDIAEARYKVYKAGEFNSSFVSSLQQYPSVPVKADYQIPMDLRGGNNNFTFPLDDEERQWFRVVGQTFSSNDEYRFNDTITHIQIFDRYYSYDDFSAEKTYHLNLVGTNIAVEFNTPVSDTLRGILVNFVETFEPVSFHKVVLKVYSSLNSQPLYESAPVDVIKTSAGRFHRYVIPEDIILEGKFYIGWEQYDKNKTYVGFDVNFNNQERTFISEVPGVWSNTIYPGTVMIRADFGNGTEDPLNDETMLATKKIDFSIFPNPAESHLYITQHEKIRAIDIFDMNGRSVKSINESFNSIDISDLHNGFYILRIVDLSGKFNTHKLIVSH